jgi:nucleoside-diphosphate-sugar epimerase
MALVLITGASGLIGSEATRFFASQGFDVVGVDNDLRRYFFGDDGSTAWRRKTLSTPTFATIRRWTVCSRRMAVRSAW